MDFRPCIRIRDLKLEISGKTIYDRLQLEIPTGCLAVMTGVYSPAWNTLLHMLAGMQPVQDREIELWGYPIGQISRRDMNANISYVPRRFQAVFDYTVSEFILRGSEVRLKPLQGIGFPEEEMARQILTQMKIERLASRNSDYLNNADHKKVGLARAMMQQAHLMLLDEPLDSMNDEDQEIVMSMLQDYTRQNQKTVLAAMQDAKPAMQRADILIIFDNSGIAAVVNRRQADFAAQAESILTRVQSEPGHDAGNPASKPAAGQGEDAAGSDDRASESAAGFF